MKLHCGQTARAPENSTEVTVTVIASASNPIPCFHYRVDSKSEWQVSEAGCSVSGPGALVEMSFPMEIQPGFEVKNMSKGPISVAFS